MDPRSGKSDKGLSSKGLRGSRGSLPDAFSISKLTGVIRDVSFDAINSLHYWRHNLSGNKVEKKYFSTQSIYPPVVLIQGFLGTRGVLKPLEYHLKSEGRDVISLDLGPFNVGDIRESAHHLQRKMERLMDRFSNKHGLRHFDIVGHSMGGLIGLYYVKKLGGHRQIRKMVALGAPFNGTWATLLALFPLGPFSKGLWQMMPQSEFLKSLKSHPSEMHSTEVVSISARYDTICPPRSCYLRGAENHSIPVGHGGLLMDQRVFESVSRVLTPEASLSKQNRKVVPFSKK